MPVNVHFDENDALIVLVYRGVVTPENILAVISDMRIRSASVDKMDRFHYLDVDADLSQIDFKNLMVVKDSVSENVINGEKRSQLSFRSAFVVESVINHGIIKLYTALWESDLDNDPTFKLFEAKAEALKWLNKDDVVTARIEKWIRPPD
ncbi:MAG: hypothetical protein RIC36_01075 [Rhodospirillales bacterium]